MPEVGPVRVENGGTCCVHWLLCIWVLVEVLSDRIGERVFGLGIPGRVVAMIDRRPYEQQKQEPYVVGSCQVLEDYS